MNILITRPLIDSEDLMGKLFSLGHKIIHIPTLKISAVKTDSVDINQYDALIFTSANAIRNLKVLSEEKSKLCFCVGSITEKIARQLGYHNTLSAGGTVNALKNLIISSDQINEKSNIAYFCGEFTSIDLEQELKKEGFQIKKVSNYTTEQITDLNNENRNIISNFPPDLIFVYSSRSAQSFIEIVKRYSLDPLMTQSKVMCISNKVLNEFKKAGWKKLEIFEPGNELLKLR